MHSTKQLSVIYKPLHTTGNTGSSVNALCELPNGLVVAGLLTGNLVVLDPKNWKETNRFTLTKLAITKLRFISRHKLLCVASNDKTLRLIDLTNNHTVHTLVGHLSAVADFIVSENSHILSIDSKGELIEWDFKKKTSVLQTDLFGVPFPSRQTCLQHRTTVRFHTHSEVRNELTSIERVSSDKLLLGNKAGTVALVDRNDWRVCHSTVHSKPIVAVFFHKEDIWVVSSDRVTVHSKELVLLQRLDLSGSKQITCAAVNRDASILALGFRSSEVVLCDLNVRHVFQKLLFTHNLSGTTSVAFGKTCLYVGLGDGEIRTLTLSD